MKKSFKRFTLGLYINITFYENKFLPRYSRDQTITSNYLLATIVCLAFMHKDLLLTYLSV